MNKTELESLDIEALLESSEYLADELRLSHAEVPANTVLELCRRLRAAKDVFILLGKDGSTDEDVLQSHKTVYGEFGVENG